jgi:taurine--2-oxoglutarate transaminase
MTTKLDQAMTGQEMVALSKLHSLFEWSAQAHVDPIPVAKSKGIYFWTPRKALHRFQQPADANIGHLPRVIKAIQISGDARSSEPFMATEARLKEAGIDLSGIDALLHQRRRGGQQSLSASRGWRQVATRSGAIAVPRRHRRQRRDGDPRRWAMSGHARHPRAASASRLARGTDSGADAGSSRKSMLEGADDSASIETVTGTNGIHVPPEGYLKRARFRQARHPADLRRSHVRFHCTGGGSPSICWKVARHPDDGEGIDERVCGARRRRHPWKSRRSPRTVFYGGLTYNSHPLGCAAALRRSPCEDKLIERAKKMGG